MISAHFGYDDELKQFWARVQLNSASVSFAHESLSGLLFGGNHSLVRLILDELEREEQEAQPMAKGWGKE